VKRYSNIADEFLPAAWGLLFLLTASIASL